MTHGRLCNFLTMALPNEWAGAVMKWLGVTCTATDADVASLIRGEGPLTPLDAVFFPHYVRKTVAEQMPTHPPTDQCEDMECLVCGMRDCPWGEPLHYHHDDCPACWAHEQEALRDDRRAQGGRG